MRGCACGLFADVSDPPEEAVAFDEWVSFWIRRIELELTGVLNQDASWPALSEEEVGYHAGYLRALRTMQQLARAQTSRGGTERAKGYAEKTAPIREFVHEVLRGLPLDVPRPSERAIRDATIELAAARHWFPLYLSPAQLADVQAFHPEISDPADLRKTKRALEAFVTKHMVKKAIDDFEP